MWALGKIFFLSILGSNHNGFHSIGDKIASTIIAQSANVPTLSWSGSGKYDALKARRRDNFMCDAVKEKLNKAFFFLI